MIKYAETHVVCPFSISGKPKTAVIRYMERDGKIILSEPNGCDDVSNSASCNQCMKTLYEDFKNGALKDRYSFD